MDMQDDGLARMIAFASFGYSARPESDVDLALALMPPKGKHDWGSGSEIVWKRVK